jgi:hypothetical protein
MPVTRKLVAQSGVQALRVDYSNRFIQNDSPSWQMLFGPNSELTRSAQVVRMGVEFDKDSLDKLYTTAYLYNPVTGNVDNAATCSIRIYSVSNPSWSDTVIFNGTAAILPNQHFYLEIPLSSIPTVSLEGGDTILIEATIVRSGTTYRDRMYVNHLGSYDSILRLRNDVDFLDITKLDE